MFLFSWFQVYLSHPDITHGIDSTIMSTANGTMSVTSSMTTSRPTTSDAMSTARSSTTTLTLGNTSTLQDGDLSTSSSDSEDSDDDDEASPLSNRRHGNGGDLIQRHLVKC